METKNRAFNLGQTVVTSHARDILQPEDVLTALGRHARCDWGECCRYDSKANESALDNHRRLVSVYHDRHGTKFWIITEADRSSTCILLPEDY